MTTMLAITGFVIILLLGNRLLQARGITQVGVDAARALMADQATMVLDVRTPAEYSRGHLRKAYNIPVAELSGRVAELGEEKSRQMLVYCASGSRSLAAARILQRSGFTRVSNLRGGLSLGGGTSLGLVK